jgi:hypothetical protein
MQYIEVLVRHAAMAAMNYRCSQIQVVLLDLTLVCLPPREVYVWALGS